MDILSRLRAQADQAEVAHVRDEATQIGFEANRLKSSKVVQTRGVAVRIVKDGRLGFAASSDESAVEKLVANAAESAAYGAEIPIEFPAPAPGPQVKTFDRTAAELPVERLVEIGEKMIDLITAKDPDARVDVKLERGIEELSIRNQAGADVSVRRSPLSVLLHVSRVRGDDVLSIWDAEGSTAWDGRVMALARRLERKVELAQESATLESGRMPVLFSPTGALVLWVPLVQGLNGESVYANISPIADRTGEKLFDEKLTIVDDPTIDGAFSSATHDDEGVPHRRHVLIERGVLRGFVHDLRTAARLGVESTGNGARTLFTPPRPSTTNIVFEPGETPLAEMIAGIDRGLLVEDALGLGQGNVVSGAFSNTLSLGFKIEKGEIVGRVKDVTVAGNVYDLLRDISAVSREVGWVHRSHRLPYILLPEVSVATKQR
ncbi:hypothetical protein AMJ82_05555 [candidate division TA06 bacterium SM23_40]|uniref:TldD/PmbA family protein n=1 Tax=candidate division TA06 bacterium SM23_40 TaxID=1703774 RepID=A0A0S8GC55_UNCT6|nr:MAG: hypothetical protein AMJ82_05555 [candidate division TA06 bacterium SM23_40]